MTYHLPDTTQAHVSVFIQFVGGGDVTLKCPYSFYGQYVTHGHSVFLEALSRTEGWFTVDDINGVFHAFPVEVIKAIHTETIKST